MIQNFIDLYDTFAVRKTDSNIKDLELILLKHTFFINKIIQHVHSERLSVVIKLNSNIAT